MRSCLKQLGKQDGFVRGGESESLENVVEPAAEMGKEKRNLFGKLVQKIKRNPMKRKSDKENIHLATLAVPEIRKLSDEISTKMENLLKSEQWLAGKTREWDPNVKAENKTRNMPGRKTDDELQYALLKELKKKQVLNEYEQRKYKYVLSEDIKPRTPEQGKYTARPTTTDSVVLAFLNSDECPKMFKILKTLPQEDSSAKKKALDITFNWNGNSITLRQILNRLSEIIYEHQTENLVMAINANTLNLQEAIKSVEIKLKLSQSRNNARLTKNSILQNWIKVISVVRALDTTLKVIYDPEKTYQEMLKDVADELKNKKIRLIDKTTKLLINSKISDALNLQQGQINKLKILGQDRTKED